MISSASISSSRRVLLRQQRRHFLSSSTRCFSNKTNNNNDAMIVPSSGELIDFNVASKIEGEESQIVTIDLEKGQTLRAESGAMLYMTAGIEMNTTTGQGGLKDGFKRMLTGQNMFLSDFSYSGRDKTGSSSSSGKVALGTDFPSKIIKLNLDDYNNKLVCQRGAYLASNPSVQIEMEFTKKFSTGFFGGQGFVLQALLGSGDVFIKAGGTLVKKELGDGETLRISSGSLVAFESSIEYDIQTMPGFKNVMFGGEGLFVTTLTGPGTVWLQGMPPDRMISEIARRVPAGGLGFGIPIAGGGGGDAESGGEDGTEAVGEGGEEDMVAASDAAIEADRQATVASSGMMGDDSTAVDSESPSALFGDAAGSNESVAAPTGTDDFAGSGADNDFAQDDFAASSEPTFQDEGFPEMSDDTSSFSTQETEFPQDEFKDETSFSTFDEDPSSSDVFDSGGAADDEEGGVAGSVLRTLWDLFTGGDD